jgi:hypothetical protein
MFGLIFEFFVSRGLGFLGSLKNRCFEVMKDFVWLIKILV